MKIKAIIKEPNKEELIFEMENDYKEIQKLVNGVFDMIQLPVSDNIDIIYNDNFLFNGMEANMIIPEIEGVLCGPLIFVGYDEETGESVSLTEEQIRVAKQYINRNKVYNMSIDGAYRYSLVMKEYQKVENEIILEQGDSN